MCSVCTGITFSALTEPNGTKLLQLDLNLGNYERKNMLNFTEAFEAWLNEKIDARIKEKGSFNDSDVREMARDEARDVFMDEITNVSLTT